MTTPPRLGGMLMVLALLGTSGCGDDSPTQVEFQVIEETTFDASLGIDLDVMTRLTSGVYIQDLEVGTGDPVDWGDAINVGYAGYLSDGSQFDAGQFPFEVGGTGAGSPILGFHEGVIGMRLGGTRKVLIPPDLAYGASSITDNSGAVVIPGGSILIFDLEMLGVN